MTGGRPPGGASARPDEGGFTLTELSVALGVLAVLITMTLQSVSILTKTEVNSVNQATDNETAALVMTELRSEVSSANVIFNPANEGTNAGTNPDGTSIPAGFSLRVYTQPNGVPTCMQWRLLDTGTLQVRSWSPAYPSGGSVTGWSIVAVGVVNTGSETPFVLDAGSNYTGTSGGRLLDVDLYLKNGSSTVEARTSIAARNAQFFASGGNDCTTVPSP